MTIAFLGLGTMGEPMATRLCGAGRELVVWNRSAPPCERLEALGARVARSPEEAIAGADIVFLMLANGRAVDEVLGRDEQGFAVSVAGRVVVNMGTVAPSYSRALRDDLARAGGRYVEAPVSGSRVPAQQGELVAMLAGDPGSVDLVEQLVGPLTSTTVRCGEVPLALETKLAVNTFLINLVTGLAESFVYAERRGVDLALLRTVLDAGPMASAVSRGKLAKLVEGDMSAQASIADVLYNTRLILDEAGAASIPLPLLATCEELLAASVSRGLGSSDMVAVAESLRRTRTPHEA